MGRTEYLRDHVSETTPPPKQSRSRTPLVLVIALVLLLVGTGVTWWLMRTDDPVTISGQSLALISPAGGFAATDGPWLQLNLTPARPGENAITVGLANAAGTPVAGDQGSRVQITAENLAEPGKPQRVEAETAGSKPAQIRLPDEGSDWWRLNLTPAISEQPATTTSFYVILPDPNLNGTDAVKSAGSDSAAEAVYNRGMAAQTGLHRVRFRQSMADGQGHNALSLHLINDGSDGQIPGFAYIAPGGLEAYVLGTYRWWRQPGKPWTVDGTSPMVPPSAWDDEYEGATDFRLGGKEMVDGELCQIVTFLVPARTESPRRVAAWYAWWVGERSGQVRREAMVSANHYMLNEFSDFDAPLPITPPIMPAPPVIPTAPANSPIG